MGSSICWLITLLGADDTLLRVALSVEREKLSDDIIEYPMEIENREKISKMLPVHCQTAGRIVNVERIFEVSVER